MKVYERHPLSAAWPDMAADEYQDLKADIKANGLFHAVKLFEGKILDGWHRYRACQEVGAKAHYEKFDGDEAGATIYAKSANGPRRNTTASQRALAYAEISKWAERGRPDKSAPGADLSTVHQTAQEARVSDRTMHQAKAVAEKGAAKLKDAVRSGEVSIKKAAAVVDLPKPEQLAAAKKQPEKPAAPATNLDEKWEPDADEEAAHEAMEKEYAASIDKVMEADDKLSAAHKEIKRQAAEIAMLKQRRDGFQNERIEAIQLCKKLQRENDRLRNQLEKKAA